MAIERFIIERLAAGDLVAVAAEAGGKLVLHGWLLLAWGSAQRCCRA
jgi:uncharacterized membrane protein YgdD (TMEM256/DUF423 family)